MQNRGIADLRNKITSLEPVRAVGRVAEVEGALIWVRGIAGDARIGDRLSLFRRDNVPLGGEALMIRNAMVAMLPEGNVEGVTLEDRVAVLGRNTLAPSDEWIGRVIDPFGKALDGLPLSAGSGRRELRCDPPDPASRRPLGKRLETGHVVFNTFLPIARGQRLGLFAGSGVGKSSLLASLARQIDADVVVVSLVGERGRELREFVDTTLGEDGMKRSVVVAATSDRSPLVRRRCPLAAMAVAEHFRDQGAHVLLLVDSITRFAEAHREVAIAAGELPALRGYPPSTAHQIMSLCERAGPGSAAAGDITAIFSVLVAGSDMEEPVADILRGVLDGHVVMDRKIAERGRYPAIDLLRSVSRSLPGCASEDENQLLLAARKLMGTYSESEMMVRAGLYKDGTDPALDQAIRAWPELDGFLSLSEPGSSRDSFSRLHLILRKSGVQIVPVATNAVTAAPHVPGQVSG
ncbi:FliI/YscN family ATPase [Primorskyibacter marinus]|uniref:FliI/YscN family ATPase n=1 Tax=Primorskyibacter marinus TaxID=1977320 RepID=UPI000E307BBD|nr:FliI/YscN family ATPase [Primorskyibacter marinus]